MSRDISVVLAGDLDFISSPPEVPVGSPEFDEWFQEAGRRHLFFAPFGSEGNVREYWSEPASRLGLPLIAAICDEGFYESCFWQGTQLDALEAELSLLGRYWTGERFSQETLSYLTSRMKTFREAIEVARFVGGVVMII